MSASRSACAVGPHSPAISTVGCVDPVARGARRQLEHRLVQADLADRELRGMHAHRQAAGAGVEVVARQRTLVPQIEPALRVQRQRVRRDDGAASQRASTSAGNSDQCLGIGESQ